MSKIKLLIFIINMILYIIPHAKGFIVYDCSSTKMNITSFNTLNVDDCTPPMPNKIEKIPIIKLLQITETKQIQFQACYIIADYLITICAGFDDA